MARKAPKESPRQKQIVGRVMHEFKHGELTRGRGGKVKNPRQAIAIALNEAGASNRQSPTENRRKLQRTERRGETAQARTERPHSGSRRQDGPTRAELYQQARKANIPGRSRMNKADLQKSLTRRRAR